ncbi:MAG: YeeE/YedE family protein [Granulosicoccus sp.]
MIADTPWVLPAAGVACGTIMGAVARHNHFCTLSSLERYWYANDDQGLRTWALAGTVAMLLTQLLIQLNLIDAQQSFYLVPRLSLLGSIVGGLLFGIGMALVGTCGFGALIRLGGGSLRSLIVVCTIGLAALSTQRGPLGALRQSFVEPYSLDLAPASDQSIPSLLSAATGYSIELPVILLCIAGLLFWVFRSKKFRSNTSSIFTGTVIGCCVAFGWFITHWLGENLFQTVQFESASFVLPPGQLVSSLTMITGSLPDYGVGLVVGVVLGAALAARWDNDVRWEACDDARELSRHLMGACLMGIGGVLAAGCTIGQGISAVSMMAVSAPLVLISIYLGARIGLTWLLEGTILPFSR